MRRISVLLAPLIAICFAAPAQELDIASLAGESWFGMYMTGKKIGYAVSTLEVTDDGEVIMSQDATFKLTMVGQQQSMRTVSKRRYDQDGQLVRIESLVDDISGKSTFVATVQGDQLLLQSVIGGQTKEQLLPLPQESLEDALRSTKFILSKPSIGDSFTSHIFEPMFGTDIESVSEVTEIETRLFDGVETKVYALKTAIKMMGLNTVSYITEDGDLLEDRVAGIIVVRLEPEAMAKDVTYSNDTIVSNAAMVDERISNPRDRESLQLKITGPLNDEHLIEDGRQSFRANGNDYMFEGKKINSDNVSSVQLPVAEPSVQEWLEPSMFVQSDHPRIITKAEEIVGDERDALKVSEKLSQWVTKNMRSTYSARLTNSLEVLDSLEGDCTEHSMLFVGLARAAGLPAREVAGLIYVHRPQPGFYFHQWAKVWVGEWIDVDPTFGQPIADATHIKLAEGDLLEQTKLLPVIGQLDIEVLSGE